MKRKIWGLTAVVLAISLSAFSALHKKDDGKFAQYYWFPLAPDSGVPEYSNILLYQSGDPTECGNFAPVNYCEGAFTSYTGSYPTYNAAGLEVMIHYPLVFY